jgi:cytosine/adenosine deaminase-related metal-dependent hydrolase
VSLSSKPPFRIYRAPWVVPVTSQVVSDGAIVVDNETIVAVGAYSDISRQHPDLSVTVCSGVLLPALVNCHIHLELSVYGVIHPPTQASNMCDWIKVLLQSRENANFSLDEIRAAAKKMAQKQYDSGIGLMLDVGNIDIGKFDSCPLEIHSLYEMLGPSKAATQKAIEAIEHFPVELSVTAHAPYSTSPNLLKVIKNRCRNQEQLFSFHLAENLDEGLLLSKGEGCFARFLKDRTGSDSPFPIPGIDSSTVVEYLQRLGILDSKTICVHCVHLNDEEIKIIADAGAHICLCPGSNKFLSVGTVRLQALLDHGILPALGTDSIASNPSIDLWQEMALLGKEHPAVSPESILSMATIGGARAMGRANDYGSLEAGKTARFLHIQDKEYDDVESSEQLLERLTISGKPESVQWL